MTREQRKQGRKDLLREQVYVDLDQNYLDDSLIEETEDLVEFIDENPLPYGLNRDQTLIFVGMRIMSYFNNLAGNAETLEWILENCQEVEKELGGLD